MAKATVDQNFNFIGDTKNDSILIGNYGDVKITAIGTFDLAGLIFCRQSKVEFTVAGGGIAKFKGICKELIIQSIEGDCTLDLSDLTCKSVRCNFANGRTVINLGITKSVELVRIEKKVKFNYKGSPFVYNHADYRYLQ